MRFAWLYLRSRLTGQCVAVIACIAALAWAFASRVDASLALIPLLLLPPAAMAVVVGAGASAPFGEAERTASRPLPLYRLTQLSGLLALGVVGLLLAATAWQHADGGALLTRNLAGFAGLALLGAWLTGAPLSWLAPLAATSLAAVLNAAERTPWWDWALRPASDDWASVVALGLLVAGLAAVTRPGACAYSCEAI